MLEKCFWGVISLINQLDLSIMTETCLKSKMQTKTEAAQSPRAFSKYLQNC